MASSRSRELAKFVYARKIPKEIDEFDILLRAPNDRNLAILKSELKPNYIEKLFGTILDNERQLSENKDYYRGQIFSIKNDRSQMEFDISIVDLGQHIDRQKFYRTYSVKIDNANNFNLIDIKHYAISEDDSITRIENYAFKPNKNHIASDMDDIIDEEKEFDSDHAEKLIDEIQQTQKYAKISAALQYYAIEQNKIDDLKIGIEQELKKINAISPISFENKEKIVHAQDAFKEIKQQYWDFEAQVETQYSALESELSNHLHLARKLHTIAKQVDSEINQERKLDWINTNNNTEAEIRQELLYFFGNAQEVIADHINQSKKEYNKMLAYFKGSAIPKEELLLLQDENKKILQKISEEAPMNQFYWFPRAKINTNATHPTEFAAHLEEIINALREIYQDYLNTRRLLSRGTSQFNTNMEALITYFNKVMADEIISHLIKISLKNRLESFSCLHYSQKENAFSFIESKYNEEFKKEDYKNKPTPAKIAKSFASLKSHTEHLRLEIERADKCKILDSEYEHFYIKQLNRASTSKSLLTTMREYHESHSNLREELRYLLITIDRIETNPELASRLSRVLDSLKKHSNIDDTLNSKMQHINSQLQYLEKLPEFFKIIEKTISTEAAKFEAQKHNQSYGFVLQTLSKIQEETSYEKKIHHINEIIIKDYKLLSNDTLSYHLREALRKLFSTEKEEKKQAFDVRSLFSIDNKIKLVKFDSHQILNQENKAIEEMNACITYYSYLSEALETDYTKSHEVIQQVENQLASINQIRTKTNGIIIAIQHRQEEINDKVDFYFSYFNKHIGEASKSLNDSREYFIQHNEELNTILEKVKLDKAKLSSTNITLDEAIELEKSIHTNTTSTNKILRHLGLIHDVIHTNTFEKHMKLTEEQKKMVSLIHTIIIPGLPFWSTQGGKFKVTIDGETFHVPHRIQKLAKILIELKSNELKTGNSILDYPKNTLKKLLESTFPKKSPPSKSTALASRSKYTDDIYNLLMEISRSNLNSLESVEFFNQALLAKTQIISGHGSSTKNKKNANASEQEELFDSIKYLVSFELEFWQSQAHKGKHQYHKQDTNTKYILPHRIQQMAKSIDAIDEKSTPIDKLNLLLGRYATRPGFFKKNPSINWLNDRTKITKKFYDIMADLSKSDLSDAATIRDFHAKIRRFKLEVEQEKEKQKQITIKNSDKTAPKSR